MAPEAIAALRVQPLLDQLETLEAENQGACLAAVTLRQLLLEHILAASLKMDAVLGRIESEASFSSEDRYVLETRKQRQVSTLNILTFAVGGALGATGSAMQLTSGLNHAGIALQAASGGTSLISSSVQFKLNGGKVAIRTPYNMLAEILDQPANSESHYPAVVQVYLHLQRSAGRPSVAESLIAAWKKLDRLKVARSKEDSIQYLIADRTSNMQLTAKELADREAMLHDLHSHILLFKSELEEILLKIEEPSLLEPGPRQ